MAWQVVAKRQLLLEKLADVDEEVAELYLMEEEPSVELLMAAIRRQTIARNFVPVCMGSAFKNKVALTYYLLLATHYLLLATHCFIHPEQPEQRASRHAQPPCCGPAPGKGWG